MKPIYYQDRFHLKRIFVHALGIILKILGLPPLKGYERCPECGSTFVEWGPSPGRRYRCLVKACRWTEEEESLPLRNYLTGRPLETEEIFTMVRPKILKSIQGSRVWGRLRLYRLVVLYHLGRRGLVKNPPPPPPYNLFSEGEEKGVEKGE